MIEISPEHYDLFVAECDIASREYAILKNGVVAGDCSIGESRVIRILCDQEEANQLLDAAKRLYPEAVPAIRDALNFLREL